MQPRPTVEPPEMSSSLENGSGGSSGPREQKEPFEQEHSAILGTAHPNILNLLSADEQQVVKSRATAMVMTIPDVIVNPFWAKFQHSPPKPDQSTIPQTATPITVSDSNLHFLNAYQRPAVSLAPTFKRPCSEATLAKLKRKFAKTASQTPKVEVTVPPPPPSSDPFQTSILKDILLGNRSKPEVPKPVPVKSTAANGQQHTTPFPSPPAVNASQNSAASKPTPVVTIDDEDDIRLISATSRTAASYKENHKENRSQISNQNRSSVICKIPSSAKNSLPEVKNNAKAVPRIEQFSISASEISGKHFIDSIFKNIMCPSNRKTKESEKSEKQLPIVPTVQPPKQEAPQPLPKSDNIKPKPIILEPKTSPSCASALCALLQTKSEPEVVIKPKRFDTSHQSTSSLEGSTNRVYQQMIEFEYNHEFIVKKFKQQDAGSSFSPSFSTKLELNSLEKSYQDELSNCLNPLHSKCLFSIQFPEPAITPPSLPGPKTKTESLVNLLIHLTSQLVTFAGLNTFDQMSLLSGNIIELLLLRSLLIKPNCISEQFEEQESPTYNDEDNDFEREENDADDDEIESDLVIEEEEEEILQFRELYRKLAQTVDKNWCKDKTIFNLIFAILLFKTSKSQTILINKEKIREQHLSYVYLLKRHLEQKFRSFCTARSHFIRIFDHLEELHAATEKLLELNSSRPEIPVLELFCFC